MTKFYAFAGIELAVEVPEQPEDRTLAPFRVEQAEDPYYYTFQRVAALEEPKGTLTLQLPGIRLYTRGEQSLCYLGNVEKSWQTAWLRCCRRGRRNFVQVGPGLQGPITEKTILQAVDTAHLLALEGSFVLHCAYIDVGGKAILFTAPSGTGKSTQAELWKTHRGARIINGDRAAVRVTEKGIMAAWIPFAGSSSYCRNETIPIAAVVYLAQGQKNIIRRLEGYEAFARVWEGISLNTWRQEDVDRVSGTVQRLSETVPVYHLACTPDESAVEVLEMTLKSGGNQ